jgi:hypothetical protein
MASSRLIAASRLGGGSREGGRQRLRSSSASASSAPAKAGSESSKASKASSQTACSDRCFLDGLRCSWPGAQVCTLVALRYATLSPAAARPVPRHGSAWHSCSTLVAEAARGLVSAFQSVQRQLSLAHSAAQTSRGDSPAGAVPSRGMEPGTCTTSADPPPAAVAGQTTEPPTADPPHAIVEGTSGALGSVVALLATYPLKTWGLLQALDTTAAELPLPSPHAGVLDVLFRYKASALMPGLLAATRP